MRVLRVYLLMLLALALPVRGWVGDAMAMKMAQAALQATAAASAGAATAPMADATMPGDCPMHHAGHMTEPVAAEMAVQMAEPTTGPMTGQIAGHANAAHAAPVSHAHASGAGHAAHATAADPAGEPHAGHASACTLCDICHGASLASAPTALGAVVAPHAVPVAASTRFASVLRAPHLRPPIL